MEGDHSAQGQKQISKLIIAKVKRKSKSVDTLLARRHQQSKFPRTDTAAAYDQHYLARRQRKASQTLKCNIQHITAVGEIQSYSTASSKTRASPAELLLWIHPSSNEQLGMDRGQCSLVCQFVQIQHVETCCM